MNTKLYFLISLRIVLLFSSGFLFSFIWDADGIHEFMGDTMVNRTTEMGGNYEAGSTYTAYGHGSGCPIGNHYHWGNRHYWFIWMSIFLFILTLIDFTIGVVKLVKSFYPNLKTDL